MPIIEEKPEGLGLEHNNNKEASRIPLFESSTLSSLCATLLILNRCHIHCRFQNMSFIVTCWIWLEVCIVVFKIAWTFCGLCYSLVVRCDYSSKGVEKVLISFYHHATMVHKCSMCLHGPMKRGLFDDPKSISNTQSLGWIYIKY